MPTFLTDECVPRSVWFALRDACEAVESMIDRYGCGVLSGKAWLVTLARMGLPKIDVQAMTPAERLDLMSRIWESFAHDPDCLPVTAAQAAELDRRMKMLDQGKMPTISWDEIQARQTGRRPNER